MVLLTDCDDSSLVIDKLCDEIIAEEDTAVVCFYFDYASQNEQSPVNMLGSLLRQLVHGLDPIPEPVVQCFRKEKRAIGGRGLQVSGIVEMFQIITATKRTFICVDALDECVPKNRTIILESLGKIVQGSPDTRIFLTGRSHIRSEVKTKLNGAAMMNSSLEANIMESIPEICSET